MIRFFYLALLVLSSSSTGKGQEGASLPLKLGINYERHGDELVIMGLANGAKATGAISVGSFIREINGRPVSSFADRSSINAEIVRQNPVRLKGRGYNYWMESSYTIDVSVPLTPVNELDASHRMLEWVDLQALHYPQSDDIDVNQIRNPAQATFIGLCLEKGIQTQVVGVDRFREDPKNNSRDEARRNQLKQALAFYRVGAAGGNVFARNRVANYLIDRDHSTLMEAGSLDDMEEGARILRDLVAEGDLSSRLDFLGYQIDGLSFVFAKVIPQNTRAAWEESSALYQRGVAGAYGYFGGLSLLYGEGGIKERGFEALVSGHGRGYSQCTSQIAFYYLEKTSQGIRDFDKGVRFLEVARANGSAWAAEALVTADEWIAQGAGGQRQRQRCDSCYGSGTRGTGSSMGGWTECYSCGGRGYR